MAKLTLSNISSGYASTTTINANNDLIEAAIENTLSRDGSTPNQMAADIDMNSNELLNLKAPTTNNSSARLQDILDSASSLTSGSAATTSISDSGSIITSTNVEGALQELGGRITNIWFNPMDPTYGAVGDGTADDTTALQNAATAAAGSVLYLPPKNFKVTATITLPANTTIRAFGAKITSTVSADDTLYANSSNIHIYGLEIEGLGNSSYTGDEKLIHIEGTNNAPAAPTFVSNIVIKNCYLHGVGDAGILFRYVNDADISHNRVEEVGYRAIATASCNRVKVGYNTIVDVSPGTSGDAYGIYFAKRNAPLTEDPICTHCVAIGNVIQDIPAHEAMDTHGGEYISFIGNTVKNCEIGLGLVKAANGSGTEIAAASYCSAIGNTITCNNDGQGIVLSGLVADSLYCIGNTITGNTLRYCGNEAVVTSAGIGMSACKGTVVANNTLEYCGALGIGIGGGSYGFSITGNTIKDTWSDSVTPRAIRVIADEATGYIGENSIIRDDTSIGASVSTRGIDVNGDATNVIRFGTNYNEATNPYIIGSVADTNAALIERGTESGTASTGSNSLDISVTFNETFQTAPAVRLSTNNAGGGTAGGSTVHAVSITTSGFTARIKTTDGTNFASAYSFDVYWEASGD